MYYAMQMRMLDRFRRLQQDGNYIDRGMNVPGCNSRKLLPST